MGDKEQAFMDAYLALCNEHGYRITSCSCCGVWPAALDERTTPLTEDNYDDN